MAHPPDVSPAGAPGAERLTLGRARSAPAATRRRSRRPRRTAPPGRARTPAGRRRRGPAGRKLLGALGQARAEVPRQPAEREDRGALVDRCAELELLGRHEAGGAEHPAHRVAARAPPVGVQVDHGQPARGELDEQAAVVEIGGHPAQAGEALVQVDQDVEDPEEAVRREVREPLVRRPRVRAAGPVRADRLPRRPGVDQHGPGGGLDHVVEADQRRMLAGTRQLDGVTQQGDPAGVVEVRDRGAGRWRPGHPGRLDEHRPGRGLDEPGHVAGVLRAVVERRDHRPVPSHEDVRRLRRRCGRAQRRHGRRW